MMYKALEVTSIFGAGRTDEGVPRGPKNLIHVNNLFGRQCEFIFIGHNKVALEFTFSI